MTSWVSADPTWIDRVPGAGSHRRLPHHESERRPLPPGAPDGARPFSSTQSGFLVVQCGRAPRGDWGGLGLPEHLHIVLRGEAAGCRFLASMHYGNISTHADEYDTQQGRWRVTTSAYLYEWPLRFPVEPKQEGARSGRGARRGKTPAISPQCNLAASPVVDLFRADSITRWAGR
jgi:hypothetical protein